MPLFHTDSITQTADNFYNLWKEGGFIFMPVYKNEEKNTWYASFYYTDWTGQRKRKKKEGFTLKRDAQEYERSFKLKQSGSCDMAFRQMTELYLADCKIRQKPTSYAVKENAINKHIIFFPSSGIYL